jgi:hypothetical protein
MYVSRISRCCNLDAGRWCGQHQDPPIDDNRLVGGNWLVENVLRALDHQGEFFFQHESKLLYAFPNASKTDKTGLHNLSFAMLDTYVIVEGASNILLSNLGLRDSAATYFSKFVRHCN